MYPIVNPIQSKSMEHWIAEYWILFAKYLDIEHDRTAPTVLQFKTGHYKATALHEMTLPSLESKIQIIKL